MNFSLTHIHINMRRKKNARRFRIEFNDELFICEIKSHWNFFLVPHRDFVSKKKRALKIQPKYINTFDSVREKKSWFLFFCFTLQTEIAMKINFMLWKIENVSVCEWWMMERGTTNHFIASDIMIKITFQSLLFFVRVFKGFSREMKCPF